MHILKWLLVYLIIGWMFGGAFADENENPPLSFILLWPVWIIGGLFLVFIWLVFKFGEKINRFVLKRHRKIHRKIERRKSN